VGGREKEREGVKNVVRIGKQDRAGSRTMEGKEKERELKEEKKRIRGFIKKHDYLIILYI